MKRLSYIAELRTTLILALPIAAGQLGQMIMGFTDTLMIGQVGVVPLAASAFANALLHFFFVIGIGLMTSISVLISHAFGADDEEGVRAILHRGVYLGGITGVFVALGCFSFWPFMDMMGQDPEVVEVARFYYAISAVSLPFSMVFIAFKAYSESINLPWTVFWASLAGILLNVVLNWILIYGHLGFPAMGLDGAGIGTFISRIFTLGLGFWMITRDRRFKSTLPHQWLHWPNLRGYSEMIRLGFPVSMQLLIEVGTFGIASLLAGSFGVVSLAAHQIVITCAAMTFMIPLGIGIAVTVRIGHVLGANERARARTIGFSTLIFVALLSLVFASGFVRFNEEIAGIFTKDAATIELAAYLLIIAGIFQLVDATQVVAIGSLRGTKDVVVPTIITACSFLFVALGGGSYLGFILGLEVKGIWMGLASGLAFASSCLIIRFAWITRKGMGKHLQALQQAKEAEAARLAQVVEEIE